MAHMRQLRRFRRRLRDAAGIDEAELAVDYFYVRWRANTAAN